MMPSRRNPLQEMSPTPDTHVGLWLDKYLVEQLRKGESVDGDRATPQVALIQQAAAIPESALYKQYFARWERGLAALGAITRIGTVQGRMIVGLGDESVMETSVTLHHTYGTPYLPGSALKGLAARYAHRRLVAWEKGSAGHTTLFGSADTAGYVTFFDALYRPRSGYLGRALHPDIMTVHHPDYYQGKAPPADWDNPTPIPFLSATGSYLVALAGPAEWVQAGFEILKLALAEEGIGAKTSSGYGRIRMED